MRGEEDVLLKENPYGERAEGEILGVHPSGPVKEDGASSNPLLCRI